MFNIGDRVVYPMHGAGIIETIEEKEILGEKNKYYILKVPIGDMHIMIPIEKTETLRIRSVVSREEAKKVIELLGQSSTDMNKNWTKRYKENENKIKGGHILEVAEVVRNLTLMDKIKRLSTGEKKILSNAKEILISELIMALGISQEEIEELLEKTVKE